MLYGYTCQKCKHVFDLNCSVSDRDKATREPCPACSAEAVTRDVSAANISYTGFISLHKRAGSGFNDLLKKIKKGAGKNAVVNHV
jgi:putative FmdB family regulatory protein